MKKPTLAPSQIQALLRAAAACDAIVTTKDWLRAFRYNANWRDGVAMAHYDNGAGDHVFVFFAPNGQTIIKGFDHTSGLSPHAQEEYGVWPGIYDDVPAALMALLEDDDSVEHEDVTFCFWSTDGVTWSNGSAVIPDGLDDGSGWLLDMLQMNVNDFVEWGQAYYKDGFDRIGVEGVRKHFSEE